MSTNGYEDCVAGKFYGFEGNNELNPGDTFFLQWGAIKDGDLPLNISLGRPGGTLIDPIVVGADFTEGSSLYQLVKNTTANCTLEQYSWAIPKDFNTSNPAYQIGLFDGNAKLGTSGVALYGWISWSPNFYVRKATSTTSSTTGTSTASSTATDNTITTSSSSSAAVSSDSSSSSDSGLSNSSKIGIGVGVGVGVAALALILLLAFYFLRRRKNGSEAAAAAAAAQPHTPAPTELPATSKIPQELPAQEKRPTQSGTVLHEMAG